MTEVHSSPTHAPYRDDVELEMTSMSDHEVHDDGSDEGQLMLREGSKTDEPANRSRCRKCPWMLLALILLVASAVGFVNKHDIVLDLAMVKKVLHMNRCSFCTSMVKLESTTGEVIQIFELQLFSNGVNIAPDGIATQSSTYKLLTADMAVDDDVSSFSHTALEDGGAWWQLELKDEHSVEKLTILNRFCGGPSDPPSCLCRLSFAKLSFMDESGAVILTESFGNTCHEEQLDLDLSSCNDQPKISMEEESDQEDGVMESTYEPTYFPSKVPSTNAPIVSTSAPTYNPTYMPSKSPTFNTIDVETPDMPLKITSSNSSPLEDEIEPEALINPSTDFSLLKQTQIANYISGKALILNIHITHHAGTSVCSKMTDCGPTPSFACMKQKSGDGSPWPENDPELNRFDLNYDDADVLVTTFRPYFHFMSMEYPHYGNLHNMNWEYPALVSMIVMRNPLDRFLAGGKCGSFHNSIINEADPDPDNGVVQRLYWEYANDICADNYALRVLAADNRCDENNMEGCFQSAKSLLERFTFILDEDCLDESMEAMGNVLGLHITADGFESRHHHYHPSAQERINNETLYEFLLNKFHYDMQLYEWSKNMSVVRCSDLVYEIEDLIEEDDNVTTIVEESNSHSEDIPVN
ncbi:hypothetical protein ACHAWO_011166 [Cyclotella atomus]|uniref:Uncharacterized protein n=1 Tax=Cyclotella atomus TaxID=382360 RepID=A0ABD3QFD6_9STRA